MSLILALDLSFTSTGYTVLSEDGELVFDRKEFKAPKGLHRAARFYDFGLFLDELMDSVGPDMVVYEDPPFLRSRDALNAIVGLVSRVQEKSAMRAIPFYGVNANTLKKWATGDGHANKNKMKEFAVLKYPGYDLSLDPGGDIADSLHLCMYAKEKLC